MNENKTFFVFIKCLFLRFKIEFLFLLFCGVYLASCLVLPSQEKYYYGGSLISVCIKHINSSIVEVSFVIFLFLKHWL